MESKTLSFDIEPGMADGEKVVFEREAEQHPDVIPGDVVFILKQKPNKRFKRVLNNLYTEMEVTLQEALLGFRKKLVHLDGRTIEVRSPEGEIIEPFSWMTIAGEGMPLHNTPSEKGDLLIKFKVKLPGKLNSAQRNLLEEIFKESS